MELHFPEVITYIYVGQPIPEAEMLKWLIEQKDGLGLLPFRLFSCHAL